MILLDNKMGCIPYPIIRNKFVSLISAPLPTFEVVSPPLPRNWEI